MTRKMKVAVTIGETRLEGPSDVIALNGDDIREEYDIVHGTRCSCGGRFAVRWQRLVQSDALTSRVDELHAHCLDCGRERTFRFDATPVFKRRIRERALGTHAAGLRTMATVVGRGLGFSGVFVLVLLAVFLLLGPPIQFARSSEKALLAALGLCCAVAGGGLFVWLRSKHE